MEQAALQKILEAEKKADGIISEGIQKAREISEKSAQKVKRLKTEFEESLDSEIDKIINAKIKEAEKEALELEGEYTRESESIREKASVNIEKAVEFVAEKIGSGSWQ